MSDNSLMSQEKSIRSILKNPTIQARLQELLKDRAAAYTTSIITISESSKLMKEVASSNPMSILKAAMVSATLDLPIQQSLGFAYVVPYKNKRAGTIAAQFQLGWKGFVQLAIRSGQYARMNVTEVYENQFTSYNTLTEELVANFDVEGAGKIIGYAAYFKLVSGFEKTVFYKTSWLMAHGERYSQSFRYGTSLWQKNPGSMCMKTAIKLTLSKWGILSVDMQRAQRADQAMVVSGSQDIDLDNDATFSYDDNPEEAEYEEIPAPDTAEGGDKQQEKGKVSKTSAKGKTKEAPKADASAKTEKKTAPAETATEPELPLQTPTEYIKTIIPEEMQMQDVWEYLDSAQWVEGDLDSLPQTRLDTIKKNPKAFVGVVVRFIEERNKRNA